MKEQINQNVHNVKVYMKAAETKFNDFLQKYPIGFIEYMSIRYNVLYVSFGVRVLCADENGHRKIESLESLGLEFDKNSNQVFKKLKDTPKNKQIMIELLSNVLQTLWVNKLIKFVSDGNIIEEIKINVQADSIPFIDKQIEAQGYDRLEIRNSAQRLMSALSVFAAEELNMELLDLNIEQSGEVNVQFKWSRCHHSCFFDGNKENNPWLDSLALIEDGDYLRLENTESNREKIVAIIENTFDNAEVNGFIQKNRKIENKENETTETKSTLRGVSVAIR